VAPLLEPASVLRPPNSTEARRETARAEGYASGYEAGLRGAEAEVAAIVDDHRRARDRLLRAAAAVEDAARALAVRDAVTLDAIEADVIALALELATEIVGRELSVTPEPVRDALERAIGLVPDRGRPTVRVHPDDACVVGEELARDQRWGGAAEIVADVRVEPGGCVVEVGDCRIDAQVTPALQRARTALEGTLLARDGMPGQSEP
jgi:flagellar assembly protein FliH